MARDRIHPGGGVWSGSLRAARDSQKSTCLATSTASTVSPEQPRAPDCCMRPKGPVSRTRSWPCSEGLEESVQSCFELAKSTFLAPSSAPQCAELEHSVVATDLAPWPPSRSSPRHTPRGKVVRRVRPTRSSDRPGCRPIEPIPTSTARPSSAENDAALSRSRSRVRHPRASREGSFELGPEPLQARRDGVAHRRQGSQDRYAIAEAHLSRDLCVDAEADDLTAGLLDLYPQNLGPGCERAAQEVRIQYRVPRRATVCELAQFGLISYGARNTGSRTRCLSSFHKASRSAKGFRRLLARAVPIAIAVGHAARGHARAG